MANEAFETLVSMAGVDIEELDHRKSDPDFKDKFGHGWDSLYVQDWRSADVYAYKVLTKEITTGRFTELACWRYLYDRSRNDIELRCDEINGAIAYANELRHSKGGLAGKRAFLMEWMIFVLANLFGWYYSDKDNKRRFNQLGLMVARGNAKSFLMSIIVGYELLVSRNGEPLAMLVATNEEQAKTVLNDFIGMSKKSHKSITRRYRYLKDDVFGTGERGGLIHAYPAKAEALDSKRVSIGIVDELHAHPSGDVKATVETGCTASINPIVFWISTAGKNINGVCVDERNTGRKVLEHYMEADSMFYLEYSIDTGKFGHDNWDDPETWIKSNPSLGHAVNKDTLLNFCNLADTPVKKRDFMTKYCNLFVNINDHPLIDTFELTEKCADNTPLEEFYGCKAYIGLDLSEVWDMTGITLLIDAEENELTEFGNNIYQFAFPLFPRGAYDKLPHAKREMYQKWQEAGKITVTDTEAIDHNIVYDTIVWLAKHFDIQAVGYDPYNATQLVPLLEKIGLVMVRISQSALGLSEATKMFQSLVSRGRLKYFEPEGDPFVWSCGNALIWENKQGQVKPDKDSSDPHAKTDLVMSLIDALCVAKVNMFERQVKDPYQGEDTEAILSRMFGG